MVGFGCGQPEILPAKEADKVVLALPFHNIFLSGEWARLVASLARPSCRHAFIDPPMPGFSKGFHGHDTCNEKVRHVLASVCADMTSVAEASNTATELSMSKGLRDPVTTDAGLGRHPRKVVFVVADNTKPAATMTDSDVSSQDS